LRVEFHRSAFKHGLDRNTILHALEHALTIIELAPAADPPRILAIGADPAGNLLEIVWLELDGRAEMVIHAMPLRPAFHALLPTQRDQP